MLGDSHLQNSPIAKTWFQSGWSSCIDDFTLSDPLSLSNAGSSCEINSWLCF